MTGSHRLAGVVELSQWIQSNDDARNRETATVRGTRSLDASDDGEPFGEAAARDIAIRALGRRAASRHELSQILSRRGIDETVAESVLDRLEAERLIDDAEFARDLAERLRERKKIGERGVAAELRRRRVDPSVLGSDDAIDEESRAIEVATDRRRRLGNLDPATIERRLAGYLQRRGFRSSAVRGAIEASRPAELEP